MGCCYEGCKAGAQHGARMYRLRRGPGSPWVCHRHLPKMQALVEPELWAHYVANEAFFKAPQSQSDGGK